MKKLTVLAILFFSIAIHQQTNAQIKFSLNLNLGSQPAWGPVGYDHVDYYYMPDIDAYYNVPQRQFVYMERNRWVFSSELPARYHGYNLYSGYKVVVNEPRPYLHADVYRAKYSQYKGGRGPSQVMIRDSHEDKYRSHPGNKYHNDNGHGNGRGHDKDHKN